MPKLVYLIISVFISLFFLFGFTTLTYAQGTCEVVRVPGPQGRGVTNEIRNNCDSGYKPDPTFGTTNRCTCVADSIQLCQNIPNSCFRDEDCKTGPGCEQYSCSGLIAGRNIQGRCVDSTKICAKANATCTTNADCQGPGGVCSQYTCWDHDGKSKDCRLGVQTQTIGSNKCPSSLVEQCKKDNKLCREGKCVDVISSAGESCDNNKGVKTAIGCIHTDPAGLVRDILKFSVGIGGGIAFLLMLIGAFQMIISAGDPEALKAGQERFRDAIIGLLFIIFSVFLMKILGVDILGLEAFLGYTR